MNGESLVCVDETISIDVYRQLRTLAEAGLSEANWDFVTTVPGLNDLEGRVEKQSIGSELWFRVSYDQVPISELSRVEAFFEHETAAMVIAFTSALHTRFHGLVKRGISSVLIPSSPSEMAEKYATHRQALNPPLVSERECIVSRRWALDESSSSFFGLELSLDPKCKQFAAKKGAVRAQQHRAIWVAPMDEDCHRQGVPMYRFRILIHFTLGGWVPNRMATSFLMLRFNHMWKEVQQAANFDDETFLN